MDRLTDAQEFLDGPLDIPLAGNLRDLRRVNRWLGGVSLTSGRRGAAHRRDLTLLDVGTGGAVFPSGSSREAARSGRRLHVVGTDSFAAAAIAAPGVTRVEGDARGRRRSRVSTDDAFDVVHASMVLHHLEPTRGRRSCARWPGSPAWDSW